jgi:oxygen-independent coproporphyrinogen-3 oxidase
MQDDLLGLIQKYGISGPRYTSYPPAPVFSSDFGAIGYREAILLNEENPENPDVSLYVHIPFCDTLCYFCGCTTIITRNRTPIDRYVQYLKKEVDLLAKLLNPRRRIVQMHWGGGSPTYLSPAQTTDFGHYLMRSFHFDQKAEVSVEIDPRELTYEHMRALRESGFNRVSLGVQDFDPKVQQAVNRVQDESITNQAIQWSRQLGFKSLNVDLIYGLPLQTEESFSETLEKIIEISPERIAVYNFAYVPWMKKHQKLIHSEDLPSPEAKVRILAATIGKLTEAGYEYIGMDHFAKNDDELAVAQRTRTLHRNFQGYSTKGGTDLYGLGMSAIGHFGTTYAQNAKTLAGYGGAIESGSFATQLGYRMSFDDEVRKFVIMRLMCDLMLKKSEIEAKFRICFDEYFAGSLISLEPLIEDGLVVSSASQLIVTSLGRLFLRNIAMCFDAYRSTSTVHPVYSKTV